MRLDNKIALITGGAGGIGYATAEVFFRAGAKVAIADIDLNRADDAAKRLDPSKLHVIPIAVDVADQNSVNQMVETVLNQFGKLDLLINNAGIGGNIPFLETTLDDWNRIISINLTGAFLVAQASAREMIKNGGGKIVNIASLSGQRGGNGRAAYGSAKAGLELLTKVMAVELSPYNINVNAIAPGAIETEMAKYAHDEQTRNAYHYLIPMERYGTPYEIANASLFLCSNQSNYSQGHTMNVDGGFLAAGLMFGSNKIPPSN